MRTKDEENERRQRQQLLNAAWKLFYEKGYQNTTMEDILREAGCSKGRFYYYFHAKGELLDSLYEVFDQKYEEFFDRLDRERGAYDRLLALNRFMFDFMSEQIGVELLRNLYISQLSGTTGIGFWGENRSFRKILTRIVEDGMRNGELRTDMDEYEMVSDMIAEERSQLISWCLDGGKYPLTESSMPRLERFYIGYLKQAQFVSQKPDSR
ncbi:MAG: TetR/AcrR family transcriptional regulator [Clostridiales bacterium]|nr:TetR/AcrR family transcriptional regulator [Clostridiales bacterium]